MEAPLKFDAKLAVLLNHHAAKLSEGVKDVKVYPQLRRASNQGALYLVFMVSSKERLPVVTQEQLEATFKPIHFPDGIEEIEICPILLAYEGYSRETHITFSFLESKCPSLTLVELYNLMTAVTNKLQNLVSSL